MRKLLSFSFLILGITAAAQTVTDQIDQLLANSQWKEAQQLISQSLTTPSAERIALQNKQVEGWIREGRLTEAETLLQSMKGQGNSFEQAMTQTTFGFLLLNKGRNDLAVEQLQMALEKLKILNQQESNLGATALSHLSFAYFNSGKRNQAEEAGLVALQIRENLFGKDSEALAASYNDLGIIYGSSDPDKALNYYEKAQQIYSKKHGGEHPKLAIAATNIGFAYNQLELYGDAINNFETAIAIWKKTYPQGHPNQATALMNLGLTYKRLNNTQASLEYIQQSIDQFKQAYGPRHPDIAFGYNQMGAIQLTQRKYDEAIQSFQQALRSNSVTYEVGDIRINPNISEAYSEKVMYYSLAGKADALEARHFGKTLRLTDLISALETLKTCDLLIDDLRQHTTNENDKIELGEQATEVYENGVRLSLAISELTLKPQPYRELAFYFAEKSKSAVLQELIADTEAKSFAGIPPEFLEREKQLKSEISLVVQKLSSKPEEIEEKKYREKLFELNTQYRQFVELLEKTYPTYYDLKFNKALPQVSDIQKLLDSYTAFISYFYGERDSTLYQFIVTKSKFKIQTIATPVNLKNLIRGFINSIYFSESESLKLYGNKLSPLLLPKLPSSISRLILLPSSNLGTLPFEALFTSRNTQDDYSKMPFGIKRYSISYEFSAGLLLQKEKNKKEKAPLPMFICAPVHFPEKDQLPSLPGTEGEVRKLTELFAEKSTTTKLFSEASEEQIKTGNLSQYQYLHFATHGLVDPDQPELSRIYLQTNGTEDGNLYAGEIYNLQLNADLSVLSACQTGLGKISKGEGVIGLSRALVYAGSRNNVVSFWSVADQSTAELMTDFYSHLSTGKSNEFAPSLRAAKLKMISGSSYASPYYWAPFVLIGR
jgi:CHAT domain-containing protein